MKNYRPFKHLFRPVIFSILFPVTFFYIEGQALAENGRNQLFEKVGSVESAAELNTSYDAASQNIESSELLSWTLTASQWEISRNGESVLSLAVLNDLMRTWLTSMKSLQNDTSPFKNEIIEIQYPGGEEGEVWVQELTDWLVALGVPSRYITVLPGSSADDEIIFQLYNN